MAAITAAARHRHRIIAIIAVLTCVLSEPVSISTLTVQPASGMGCDRSIYSLSPSSWTIVIS
ncbi:hypothetical protein D3C78_1580290 [compost metagenome]